MCSNFPRTLYKNYIKTISGPDVLEWSGLVCIVKNSLVQEKVFQGNRVRNFQRRVSALIM